MVTKNANPSPPNPPTLANNVDSVGCGFCGSRRVLRMVAGLQVLKIGDQLVTAIDSKRALLPVLVEMCEDCRKIQLKENS